MSASGALLAMPLLVINMGAEMVYILEQRLHAQEVGTAKSKKVLQDVLRTMYGAKFIKELFKPQEVYTTSSTREIFNKLAHSSIMRLNESSMDKLFDLMTMGVKHQIQHCSYPGQMLHVTLNHLAMLKSIADSEQISVLIDAAIQLCFESYGNMSPGDWHLLKQHMYTFFHGRRVKVSLFLQNNFQNLDGTFVLNNITGVVPMGSEVPGRIRYYRDNKVDYESGFLTPASTGLSPFDPDYHTPLGMNLYAKDLGKNIPLTAFKAPACAHADVAKAIKMQLSQCTDLDDKDGHRNISSNLTGTRRVSQSTATTELNLLAELMGAGAKAVADDKEDGGSSGSSSLKPFRINLFPEDPFDDSYDASSGDKRVETVVLDATRERKTRQELVNELSFGDDDGAKAEAKSTSGGGAKFSGGDDDDLLDLMDSLGK